MVPLGHALQSSPILGVQFDDDDPMNFGCAEAVVRLGFRGLSRVGASGGEGSNELRFVDDPQFADELWVHLEGGTTSL